jgi:hypothetical protein
MIVSPDAKNQVDGSVQKNILAHLPEIPIDIVPISWFSNFVFKRPETNRYALLDFLEPHLPQTGYDSFWQWVTDNPPLLTFRRELRASERTERLLPIEWPCYLPLPERSKREDFDSRPLEVLNFWGYSNALRPKLHGEIFSEGMVKHGIEVNDSWGKSDVFLNKQHASATGRQWISIYTPWWHRKPMSEILPFLQLSKITVSMPGNGHKTFRDTECVGTLMAIQKSDIAYAYPWTETNSIQLTPGNEFQSLLEATKRTDLYDLYCACDDQMRKYEAKTYVRDYVVPEIQKVL